MRLFFDLQQGVHNEQKELQAQLAAMDDESGVEALQDAAASSTRKQGGGSSGSSRTGTSGSHMLQLADLSVWHDHFFSMPLQAG